MQPGVAGASKRYGALPRNSAVSDTPAASVPGERLATAMFQVVAASSGAGLGVALNVTPRSTRPASSTVRVNCPVTSFSASSTSEANRVRADARTEHRRAAETPGAAQREPGRQGARHRIPEGARDRVGIGDKRRQVQIERRAFGRGLRRDRRDRRRIIDGLHRDAEPEQDRGGNSVRDLHHEVVIAGVASASAYR